MSRLDHEFAGSSPAGRTKFSDKPTVHPRGWRNGIRAGFKIQFPKGIVGSIPIPRTNSKLVLDESILSPYTGSNSNGDTPMTNSPHPSVAVVKTVDLAHGVVWTEFADGGGSLQRDNAVIALLSKDEVGRMREMFRSGEADAIRAERPLINAGLVYDEDSPSCPYFVAYTQEIGGRKSPAFRDLPGATSDAEARVQALDRGFLVTNTDPVGPVE